MSPALLYKRIVEHGTLSEPDGVPDPQFSLPSTINWMRALALLVNHSRANFTSAVSLYKNVQRKTFGELQENTVLEQLFFSLHQLAALDAFRAIPRRSDVARMGIVAWYYGIYYAASAMVAAQDGSFQDDHASTANSWDRHFASRGTLLTPFAFRVSTLVEKAAASELTALRREIRHDLRIAPRTPPEALGACFAYLSGTTDWYRWRVTEDLRDHKDFKALGVDGFRTKVARDLRDSRLRGKSVSFLHQAVRYRGKANYREALFLGYGTSVETILDNYLNDLTIVLEAFVAMAGAFVAQRLGSKLWTEFRDDVDKHRAFSIGTTRVWT